VRVTNRAEIEKRIADATAAIATHGWRADGETKAGRIAQRHLDAATAALAAAQAELDACGGAA
jgi:predicted kinase